METALTLSIAVVTLLALRLLRFTGGTLALFAGAMLLYHAYHLMPGWERFSPDAEAHAAYVEFVADYHMLPPSEVASAARHPPAYYILAAGFYTLAKQTGKGDPLSAARLASLVSYILFAVFSALLFRLLLAEGEREYHLALALLLFMPMSMVMTGRLLNDPLSYAGQMGCLYALVRWLKADTMPSLSAAFLMSGLSMLAKNSGVMMAGLCLLVLLASLWRDRARWKRYVCVHLALSMLLATLCWLISLRHGWIADHLHPVPYMDIWAVLDIFLSFQPFLFLYDTNLGLSRSYFWNMLLHSMVLGDTLPWRAEDVVLLLKLLWSALLLYLIIHLPRLRELPRTDYAPVLLLVLFAALSVGGVMAMRVHTGNNFYADARYIHPVVPLMFLCFARLLELHKTHGRLAARRIGVGVAAAFIAASILLEALMLA